MALFTRRVIQNCLDECAAIVSRKVLKDWVSRLNKISDEYIATEWEVVLIAAFARCGDVQHEPRLGERPIDLVFESSHGGIKFAADIVAISDETLHEKNPIGRFHAELRRRISKAHITTGRFIFEVQEEQPAASKGSGRKRRLLLPSVTEFAAHVFNADFDRYIEAVQHEPNSQRYHRVRIDCPAIDIGIQYQPGIGQGAGSASYARTQAQPL